MLTLRAGPAGAVPEVPPGAEVWRDSDDRVAAFGFTVAGDRWMKLPGVASFRFSDGPEVTSFAEPGVSEERVLDAYRRTVLPMALQALGAEVLHASAVRMGEGVVGLCAVSQTGKSTVAYALSRRGHRIVADDAVPFDLSGPTPRALRLPFELKLRPESASFFGVSGRVTASDHDDSDPAELAALCVLERSHPSAPGGPVVVRRLEPASSFPRVLAHAYCFSLEPPERHVLMVERYLELVARVPVFEVCLWPGLHNLDRVVDEIEGAVQAAA
ncbi:MAG: Hpr(Ser) kinase/phosphatase [Solirubrobacterales bacterium]|jgi:hypothetical protein|nr:Hpr(Ser) kinase/phosphatase [Solirubrobacterales bacterium]